MFNRAIKAKEWRDRADEIRAIAETITVESAHCDLMQLAEQWEKLADYAEGEAVRVSPRAINGKASSLRQEAHNAVFPATRRRMLAIAEQYDILGEAIDGVIAVSARP